MHPGGLAGRGGSEQEVAALEPGHARDMVIDPSVTVTAALLGESDHCEFCAACGDFIQHGLRYAQENVGCTHATDDSGEIIDPEPLNEPHIYLRSHPAMVNFLGDWESWNGA